MKYLFFAIAILMNASILHAQCFDSTNVHTFEYNGHTYKVVKENKQYGAAASCAVTENGYLAEINDVDEQNAIFSEVSTNANITQANTTNQFGTAAIWIGGSDSQTEGKWIWDGDDDGMGVDFWSGGPNGTAVNGAYTNWGTSPPEPDNSGGNQDKLTLTIASTHANVGKWNDLTTNSANELYYIIEYDVVFSSKKEIQLKDQLEVYPNPVKNVLHVKNKTSLKLEGLSISTTLGQTVYVNNNVEAFESIELAELPLGIYYLSALLENGEKLTFKIVK